MPNGPHNYGTGINYGTNHKYGEPADITTREGDWFGKGNFGDGPFGGTKAVEYTTEAAPPTPAFSPESPSTPTYTVETI